MSRVYLLVEGQTEEAFVNELLIPHYSRMGIYLTPIIVRSSPGYKGGINRYTKIRPQIEKLCKQDEGAHVSTLFDLYALPNDFPGKDSQTYLAFQNGQQKADFLEFELSKDIRQNNFIPHLIVHEFEALLFAQIEAFREWTDDDKLLNPLRVLRASTLPEDINDGPQTAPSKRILNAMPSYQKPFHGPLIACEIGLDSIRAACPHFDSWLAKIEKLA